MRKNSEIIKELESYWYDQQYLKEKLKEVEQFDKISSKSNNAEFLSETKQIEESEIKMFFQKKKSGIKPLFIVNLFCFFFICF